MKSFFYYDFSLFIRFAFLFFLFFNVYFCSCRLLLFINYIFSYSFSSIFLFLFLFSFFPVLDFRVFTLLIFVFLFVILYCYKLAPFIFPLVHFCSFIYFAIHHSSLISTYDALKLTCVPSILHKLFIFFHRPPNMFPVSITLFQFSSFPFFLQDLLRLLLTIPSFSYYIFFICFSSS